MRHAFLIASLFFSCTALAANSLPKQTPYYLWWEAESPVETDFSDIGEFDPKTPAEAAKLSNGRWLNVGGKHAKHFAHYAINLEKTTQILLIIIAYGIYAHSMSLLPVSMAISNAIVRAMILYWATVSPCVFGQ